MAINAWYAVKPTLRTLRPCLQGVHKTRPRLRGDRGRDSRVRIGSICGCGLQGRPIRLPSTGGGGQGASGGEGGACARSPLTILRYSSHRLAGETKAKALAYLCSS